MCAYGCAYTSVWRAAYIAWLLVNLSTGGWYALVAGKLRAAPYARAPHRHLFFQIMTVVFLFWVLVVVAFSAQRLGDGGFFEIQVR